MKEELPQITDSEWLIMKALWEKSPLMNRDIIQIISERSKWNNKTIETLLRRLVDKGAVGYKNVNSKAREYFPLVSQEECMRIESETFLKKVYDGSISMMMACFLKQQKVSKEELERLKAVLNENEE
ncbi:MAG: BlaI/MecI/CopY family transcriptional regulator [Clostridia bacterium]|nr:BlaI/MecI/CopY family transcriptional regulator [Clostridia bacterium]